MNCKKQTHISFSFYHSLALPKMLQSQAKLSNIRGVTNSWDILQFELKKLLDLDLKKLGVPYWNHINLIICWPWTWKTLQLPYCTRIDFMILDFDLKKTWTTRMRIDFHCRKSVHVRSYSGPYFPAFGLYMERYKVSLQIQSKFGKMRTRITPNANTFHSVFIIN